MNVGLISIVNLSLCDAYLYLNHANPRKALHLSPVQLMNQGLVSEFTSSPMISEEGILFDSAHFLRSSDGFTFANVFGQHNKLVLEFDGVFYAYTIPINEQDFPIILPMIMGVHPQFLSLETPCGRRVWQSQSNDKPKPIKLFSDAD